MTQEALREELLEIISKARHSTKTTDEVIDIGVALVNHHTAEVIGEDDLISTPRGKIVTNAILKNTLKAEQRTRAGLK